MEISPASLTITGSIQAGTNNIGDVDVLTLPSLPAGTNNIGDVDVLTLPSLPAGTNNIGIVDTELPAAAALSDTIGNPTTPMVGAAGMVWDSSGSQWVRCKVANAANASSGTGVPAAGTMVWNNSAAAWYRAEAGDGALLQGGGTNGKGVQAVSCYMQDVTAATYYSLHNGSRDTMAESKCLAVMPYVVAGNGGNGGDQLRAATVAAGTTGKGVPGVHDLAFDGTNYQTYRTVYGTHANAWSAAATGAGGTSTAVDVQFASKVSVFGNVNGATTLTLQWSQNNSNWYDTGYTIVLAGASDFGQSFDVGARYVRLKSSANVTATATISAKR